MFASKSIRHQQLPTKEEDAESLLSHSDDVQSPHMQRKPILPKPIRLLLIGSSYIIVAVLSAWISRTWGLDLDALSAKHTSHASPVLNDVKIKYHTVTYNGSFFHQTIYRQDPSPEVDAAWQALGVDYRALRVPESEALAAGIAPDQVKINPKYGGGYPANVEGLHHLHCLNLLRKSLKYNYDYYKDLGEGAFQNEEYVVKVHVSHCLDIIRQQLMCTVDTGVLGQVWWRPSGPTPFVDFNTQHQCKNFDAIRNWAEERQLPPTDQTPRDFLEPPKPGERIFDEIP